MTRLLPFLTLLTACAATQDTASYPPCLEVEILRWSDQKACAEGASVMRYAFRQDTVYLFDPGSCGADMGQDVYDADCTHLGFLGGFPGFTEIQGIPFHPNAVLLDTVWRNGGD